MFLIQWFNSWREAQPALPVQDRRGMNVDSTGAAGRVAAPSCSDKEAPSREGNSSSVTLLYPVADTKSVRATRSDWRHNIYAISIHLLTHLYVILLVCWTNFVLTELQ